jgi:beta-glucosidase
MRAFKYIPRCALAFALTTSSATAQSEPNQAIEAKKRAESLLGKMTLEEKIDMIGGVNGFYIRANDRLKLPALKMADGPLGVRNYGPSTAYAAGIALAASWDTALANRIGALIGRDARARGVHFLLGPGVNIFRAPLCGRNFEYFGEDPYLASRVTVSYILGVQSQGVSATVKHFLGNNSEYDRHGTSSDIDERTLREIYLPTFEAAVRQAHVGAIMNSYNLVNGVHMTQNAALNVDIVKKEWGFDGIIMSDWDATYDGVAAANSGLDLEMPSGKFMNREALLPAVNEKKVTVATLDDKVRRILQKAIEFGWLDRSQTDLTWPLFSQEGRKVALESAQASLVLLKNENGILPLDRNKIKSLFVVGPDAYPAVPAGGGSAQVRPFQATSFLQGLAEFTAGAATVTYRPGLVTTSEVFDTSEFTTELGPAKKRGLTGEYFGNLDFQGTPSITRVDDRIRFSWDKGNPSPLAPAKEYSVRWSGFFVPTSAGDYRFVASTYGLDRYRLFIDGKLIMDRGQEKQPLLTRTMHLSANRAVKVQFEYAHHDHHAQIGLGVRREDQFIDPDVKTMAAHADVAIVLAGFDPTNESEGYDRTFQLPKDQDELIRLVRVANKKTIVSLTSGGSVDMRRWINEVPAVLETWYAGQEAGTAFAQVIFGDVNPSGKLPVSFERRWEDSAVYRSYFPDNRKHISYSEGVFLGYRHFDKVPQKPLFPFGHGLSYSHFQYDRLAVTPETVDRDGAVTVSFDITNTSPREGAEVAQVYVGQAHARVPRPIKELKGFARVSLKPNETRRVSVSLDQRSFSYFDIGTHQWRADSDQYLIYVGSSSQKIELLGQLNLH